MLVEQKAELFHLYLHASPLPPKSLCRMPFHRTSILIVFVCRCIHVCGWVCAKKLFIKMSSGVAGPYGSNAVRGCEGNATLICMFGFA